MAQMVDVALSLEQQLAESEDGKRRLRERITELEHELDDAKKTLGQELAYTKEQLRRQRGRFEDGIRLRVEALRNRSLSPHISAEAASHLSDAVAEVRKLWELL